MKIIAAAMRKAADEAMELEKEMIHHAESIITDGEYKDYSDVVASIMMMVRTPNFNGNNNNTSSSCSSSSFGESVAALADTILLLNAEEKDELSSSSSIIVVVPKSEQKDYVRAKYGFKKKDLEIIIPPTWNPSTHYHCNDFRPLTPESAKLLVAVVEPRCNCYEYETPEGSWVVHEEEEGYLSETGENVVYVPKAEQASFARKKYGIKDLSAIPPDWNPSTHHHSSGGFRPLTPTFNPLDPDDDNDKNNILYQTSDGSCWIVPVLRK